MEHPGFFTNTGPHALGDLAAKLDLSIPDGAAHARTFVQVTTLADAGPDDLSFLDNRKYLSQLRQTRAGACLVAPEVVEDVPASCLPLVTKTPYRAFASALALFHPDALRPGVTGSDAGLIASSAQIEDGVTIEPGAVIGPEAAIGRGSRVCAGAVIGRRCQVGRDCVIGPGASMICTLMGDRVIVHGGVRLGQDGFGFAMGPQGHLKVPQIGRVIVQDDVEIGANSCADRGALKDTVIGAGTKIDNLVQIGHNVEIGRNCVIVAHVAIGGSSVLGDFVVIGGNAAVAGHITVGPGAQIGGGSQVKDSVPAGARMGGYPARPVRQWARELAWVKSAARPSARRDRDKD